MAQFYTTVHFHANEERSMSWMTSGRRFRVDWKDFMNCSGVADEGEDNPVGLRPHKEAPPTHKSKLIRYSGTMKTLKGANRTELIPFLDIMHRIFRKTLFLVLEAWIWCTLIWCIKEKSGTSMLDISHIMWRELRSVVLDCKVRIYGPYLFKMIEEKWAANCPGEALPTEHIVSHPVLNLRQKENWGTVPAGTGEEIAPTDSDGEEEPNYEFVPSLEKVPYWESKLKSKMKKLFCIEAKGQYRAHMAEKAARTRHMTMMRALGKEIASV